MYIYVHNIIYNHTVSCILQLVLAYQFEMDTTYLLSVV